MPRFEFKLGGWPGVVEVRVWPWLLLRSLMLRVGDRVVYAEGVNVGAKKLAGLPSDWAELRLTFGCSGPAFRRAADLDRSAVVASFYESVNDQTQRTLYDVLLFPAR